MPISMACSTGAGDEGDDQASSPQDGRENTGMGVCNYALFSWLVEMFGNRKGWLPVSIDEMLIQGKGIVHNTE